MLITTGLPPFASGSDLAAYSKGRLASDDPSVELTLEAVSASFRSYCGWHIYPALDVDATLDAPGGDELWLPSRQVNSVLEVRDLSATPSTVYASTGYRWSRLGQVRLGGTIGWPDGYGLLQVKFNSGYEVAPAELRLLSLQVAARSLSSPSGITHEQAGAVAVSYATVAPGVSGGMLLLGNELALLDVYRIVGA